MMPSDYNRLGHESRIKALRQAQRPFYVVRPGPGRERSLQVLWTLVGIILAASLVAYALPYVVAWWFRF